MLPRFSNPIDKAIKDFCSQQFDISGYIKLDEIPYDFIRKRLAFLFHIEKGQQQLQQLQRHWQLQQCHHQQQLRQLNNQCHS